jgi:hypothetical protein
MPSKKHVFGEFVRTFTFAGLPQVAAGALVPLGEPTVKPHGVKYVDDSPTHVGLLVPKGTYRVTWQMNPSVGASVSLLVNGLTPVLAGGYTYDAVASEGVVSEDLLIYAPNKHNNLISLKNTGGALFTLLDLPNTHIGNTSMITHISVQKM